MQILDVKAIVKEFITYSIGIMFLWLLSAAYKVKREVRDGRKSRQNSRRSSKVEGLTLLSKHRNSAGLHDRNQELHKNDNLKKRCMKVKRKKPHKLEFSFGCWALLLLPISLAILSAFIPLDECFSIFDEVWMRQKVHKLKIVFHEIVYRDPLSHYDWTRPNKTRNQEPIDETSHLTTLSPKAMKIDKRRIVPKEMQRQKKKSNVRVFVIDDLLTTEECEKLSWIHNSHVWSLSTYNPITCFDSEKTLDDFMLLIPRKAAKNTLIPGTLCMNGSLTGMMSRTIYTSQFFKGESSFSLDLADRIQTALGLTMAHGHSFTITSLPMKPDARILQNQTGCTEENQSGLQKRSFASVLMFLSDAAKGEHITFKDLGVKIEVKRGRAVAWTTNADEERCKKESSYDISPIQNGVMYTLQQWFYPDQFEGIGQRPTEPNVPFRKQSQPYMFCDKVRCQWFDNWNHFIHKSLNNI